jgi:hypothetical protein
VRSLRGSDPERLKDLANDILLAAGADSRCKLVVFIDQFEELLTQAAAADRAEFVEALASALGGPIQALATLRPEFRGQVATDPQLAKLAPRVVLVHPLGTTALRSVIEGPAKVAGLTIEEDLVSRLVTDTGTGEALPLLAFTLEQLAHGTKRADQLTHQRYLDIGGVRGQAAQFAGQRLALTGHGTKTIGIHRSKPHSEVYGDLRQAIAIEHTFDSVRIN